MQRILIVEDEPDIAENLSLFFQHHGFETHLIDDGAAVIAAVQSFQPDLVILDIMLPNKDGVTCCSEIREFSNVPVIMLTARTEQIDKLVGLEAGADDYLCKPFDVMELILRAKAILKRSSGLVQFATVSINVEKLEVLFKGNRINLSSLEFSLFRLLFNAPERIYTREQIIDLAYPEYRDITDRTIDSHVKNIRKKFKVVESEINPIQSVYGAGYRYSV